MFVCQCKYFPREEQVVLQEGVRVLTEDCPQVGVSYIQRTHLLHGLLWGQGCGGRVEGLGHFLGGRDEVLTASGFSVSLRPR